MAVHLLRGTISNLRTSRQSASFFFSDSDQSAMGVIAIAAAAAGLGSQAIAVASASTSVEEHADYLEFELDGDEVSGWVWRSPFSEGDEVEAVVERERGQNVAYAIARPSDRTIALYPHCSRGKSAHIKNAVKWWFFGGHRTPYSHVHSHNNSWVFN
ncbi:MAG TPA: putative type VI secretion system effector [Chitinolyticbacter sp.]|nr:putative type VI secretion system effector [Chitinolyticbacter sp.]